MKSLTDGAFAACCLANANVNGVREGPVDFTLLTLDVMCLSGGSGCCAMFADVFRVCVSVFMPFFVSLVPLRA